MKRFMVIDGNISFQRYNEESWSLEIKLTLDDVIPLFMEMALIEYDLTNCVTIQSRRSSNYVILSSTNNQSNIQYQGNRFYVALSSNDMSVAAAYILQFYRDHYAPVDHIDIQLKHDGGLGKDAVLVIRAIHPENRCLVK